MPGARIRRPSDGADHPRAWTVALVFAAGLAAGLLLVRSSLSHPRHAELSSHAAESAVPEPAAAPAEPPRPEPAAADIAAPAPSTPAPTLDAPGEAPTPAEPPLPPAASPTSAPGSTPATPEGEAPGRHRTVLPGRVAYLQCAGLERPGRDFPCPRDPALEAAAWEILLALPRCPAVDIGVGAADVRLRFGRTGPPEIEVREVPGSPALSPPKLLACAGESLSGLRTRLRSPRLLFSLRFVTR